MILIFQIIFYCLLNLNNFDKLNSNFHDNYLNESDSLDFKSINAEYKVIKRNDQSKLYYEIIKDLDIPPANKKESKKIPIWIKGSSEDGSVDWEINYVIELDRNREGRRVRLKINLPKNSVLLASRVLVKVPFTDYKTLKHNNYYPQGAAIGSIGGKDELRIYDLKQHELSTNGQIITTLDITNFQDDQSRQIQLQLKICNKKVQKELTDIVKY